MDHITHRSSSPPPTNSFNPSLKNCPCIWHEEVMLTTNSPKFSKSREEEAQFLIDAKKEKTPTKMWPFPASHSIFCLKTDENNPSPSSSLQDLHIWTLKVELALVLVNHSSTFLDSQKIIKPIGYWLLGFT